MTSSELSDALNPYAGYQRQPVQNYLDSFQQNSINVNGYTPHRSELEHAVPEPQHPPLGLPQQQFVPQPTEPLPVTPAGAVHELIRTVRATREAHSREAQRRRIWEQEQEVKYRQRQTEMEQQINEMRHQITVLQSALAQNAGGAGQPNSPAVTLNHAALSPECGPSMDDSHSPGIYNSQYNISPAVQSHQLNQSISPISPVPSNHPPYGSPQFIQGSSTAPQTSLVQSYYNGGSVGEYQAHQGLEMRHPSSHLQHLQNQYHDVPNNSVATVPRSHQTQASSVVPLPDAISQSVSPSPSSLVCSTDVPQSPASHQTTNSRQSRKRSKADITSSDSSSDTDSSEDYPRHRMRRTNHHDKRCLTIHHAMRSHFLRMMRLDTDHELPDSHVEAVTLGPEDPVRFVWDKTTKQSVHNCRMKTRVMNDIKENSKLYKYVPRKDFNKKSLDGIFEQCFVTFRQKFRAQRDALTAQNLKKREDAKARRARHLSRRKNKLSNRAEAREKIPAVEHVTFDGALQVECMSSEDSDYETDASGTQIAILRTRGYAWRSQRLNRLYAILDDGTPVKIKRGTGKKERYTGPLKEGLHLPPKGVASWMISKRWLNAAQRDHSDLPIVLRKLIEEPPGFEWSQLSLLGEDSENESIPGHLPRTQRSQSQVLPMLQQTHPHLQPQPHQATDYHIPQTMNMNYSSPSNLTIPQQHYNSGISSLDYALSS